MSDQANPSLRGIVGAVALVIGLVGLFTLNGVVGRVQRNEPGWFTASLALITVAAACFVLVELIRPPPSADGEVVEVDADGKTTSAPTRRERRKARARTFLLALGAGLGMLGVLAAVWASIGSTRAKERPVVTGSLAMTADRAFTATVNAGSLSSHDRVAVIVDGLMAADKSFAPHTVYQAYIGPDQEGKISHSVTLVIPRIDTYEAVGVKAYTGPISDRDPWVARGVVAVWRLAG